MQIPFFYISQYSPSDTITRLDEDNSRHIVQVLRMKKGDVLHLTDGKGSLFTASIEDDHKKHCTVRITHTEFISPASRHLAIGISPLKNNSRFEWFLEKAAELGINEIIPILCNRTERQKFRTDRMNTILISALLQSRQVWLPVLHEPIGYELLFAQQEVVRCAQKFIAHCIESEKRNLSDLINESLRSQIILIGPEGDFTREEVEFAINNHFIPVELGDTRLRAETAGVAAAVLMRLI
jgi:16S rRNA (uracil1498-N3)-methyltransferase